jgi:hypothetical protein
MINNLEKNYETKDLFGNRAMGDFMRSLPPSNLWVAGEEG